MEQAGAGASWQIVAYRDGDEGPTKFSVWHEGRRRAWGLRDRDAATRWLRRLAAPQQLALVVEHQSL